MVEPAYQELLKSDIPHVSEGGVHVAVIAGQSYGASVSTSRYQNQTTFHLFYLLICLFINLLFYFSLLFVLELRLCTLTSSWTLVLP